MAKAKYEVTVGAPSLKPKKKKTVLWIILSLIIGFNWRRIIILL